MSRPAYQVRVYEEREELLGRLQRLGTFITSAPFYKLDVAEQDRLRRQFAAMSTYCQVLEERIAAFPAPQPEAGGIPAQANL